MTISLQRVSSRLPEGFEDLQADAVDDGYRHLTRLAAEFQQSPTMFHGSLQATSTAVSRGSAPSPTSPL